MGREGFTEDVTLEWVKPEKCLAPSESREWSAQDMCQALVLGGGRVQAVLNVSSLTQRL